MADLRTLRVWAASFRRQFLMPRAYQGSVALYIWGNSVYRFRQLLKRIRRRISGYFPGNKPNPQIVELLATYQHAIDTGDWESVRRQADAIAHIGEKNSDAALLSHASDAYLRLGIYDRSASTNLEAVHLREGKIEKEWSGEDIHDGILLIDLVDDAKRGLGEIIRYIPFVAPAIRRARKTIVVTESRLVPILAHSFPDADVRPKSTDLIAAQREADAVASFEQLAFVFGRDREEMKRNFTPLKADPSLTQSFRAAYSVGRAPLVGLSWGSKSYNKDVPDLSEWARFIKQAHVQFVSLQYGRVQADLPTLVSGCDPSKVLHDATVDQLKDMNRFAAQVSALDAVISISNTTAHLAGALQVPSIVLIDNKFHTNWPIAEKQPPWYPNCEILMKRDKSWQEILDLAREKLDAILQREDAKRDLTKTDNIHTPRSR